MYVTYLNHSGFLLEWENSYWLFDYYKGTLPEMDPQKDIFVFCSHSHGDHFNSSVFSLAEIYPKVTYIFSNEIRKSCKKMQNPIIHFLKSRTDTVMQDSQGKSLKIHTLQSTDCGCAFVIEYENCRIYHAGDLHWWYWEGEDPNWNKKMTADYKKEIEYLKEKRLDLAFTPLDPRQGKHYALGMNYLLQNVSVKNVFPMHFWDDFSIIDKYLQEYEIPESTVFHRLKEDGEKKEVLSSKIQMDFLNKVKTGKVERPIKVLQFGEGNFLRAFVDYMIDIANETGDFNGDIVLVKPIEFGSLDLFHEQESQYTVQLRGIVDGEAKRINRIVTSVTDTVDAYEEYEKYAAFAKLDTLRFIVSNTTEAGIVYDDTDRIEFAPPKSYPGKLTKFLYERFKYFNGAEDKGLVILPVELIDDNGIYLKECVLKLATLWNLEEEFVAWINKACVFTSTLVDRIVTGYPRDEAEELCKEFGYQDNLIVTGEPFALWVIESEKDISNEFPLHKAGLPVIFTDNQKPYKQRKVRILNGAHTSFVLASYLAGNDIVLESMQDELVFKFMKDTIFDEVIPTLTLPKEDLIDFANAVITRFNNPYVKHALLSISLNSVSKWRARCMPSFLSYIENEGKLPKHLTFSLAALMAFYTGTEIRDKALIGYRDGKEYNILDDKEVLEFFAANSLKETEVFVHGVLSNIDFWGQDLSAIAGVEEAVATYLKDIRSMGMRAALEKTFA